MIKIDLLQQKHLFKYYDNVWKKTTHFLYYIELKWHLLNAVKFRGDFSLSFVSIQGFFFYT